MEQKRLDEIIAQQSQRLAIKEANKPLLESAKTMEKVFPTNDDFVHDLLNYSPYGGICQAFVIEAIRHYSTMVAQSDPGPLEADTGMISKHLWRDIAVNIKTRTDKHLNIFTGGNSEDAPGDAAQASDPTATA